MIAVKKEAAALTKTNAQGKMAGSMVDENGLNHSTNQRPKDNYSQNFEELGRTLAHKDEFVSETSESDFKYIVDGWEAKIVRCGEGDQKWGLFYGKKA
ncbi:hypothetical protein PRIC1_008303 [Phytophthora ramorum]